MYLSFKQNFSEGFEVLSSKDESNYIQIRVQVFQTFHLHNTVLHVDQPLRDKPFTTTFGSSEKLQLKTQQNTPDKLFQTLL